MNILFYILVISGISTILLAVYVSRKHHAAGSISYILFALAISVYSFGYAIEITQSTIEGFYLALRVEYIGIPFIAVSWFIFAMRYSGYFVKKKYTIILFLIIPLITVVLMYTNPLHHLFYKSLSVNNMNSFPQAATEKGVWYFIDYAYTILLTIGGDILFFKMILGKRGFQRKQAIMLFSGSLIPTIGVFIHILGFSHNGIDINPFFLSLANPIFTYALIHYHMFDIKPIAREQILEEMFNPVIVLDKARKIVDFNKAAGVIFPDLLINSFGVNVNEILRSPQINDALKGELTKIDIDIIRDSRTFHFDIVVSRLTDSSKKYLGFIITFHDMTEQKQLLTKLNDMATYDPLTGLYNRRIFIDQSLKEIQRAYRKDNTVSLMMMDLDKFKDVNDNYGHQMGDKVLEEVSLILREKLRLTDIYGRFGGEEFIVMLPETDIDGAIIIAERLREAIANKIITYNSLSTSVSISIGISNLSDSIKRMNQSPKNCFDIILGEADKALYSAKESGRNKVVVAMKKE